MRLIFLLFFSFAKLIGAGIYAPEKYHQNSSMQWQVAMETLEKCPINGSETILDVGCGDGKITALIASKMVGGRVVGVDISEPMIRFATTHYPSATYSNLFFDVQSATSLPYYNQFDRVVSFSALHWVIDQKSAFASIYQALKGGGIASLQTYGKSPTNMSTVADNLVRSEKWAPYFPHYTQQRCFLDQEELKGLMEQAGFQEIEITSYWNDYLFPDRSALINFMKPVIVAVAHLPQNLQDQFFEELADLFIEVAGNAPDDMIHFRTLNFHAMGLKK